jgi:hypothetical protein
LYTQSQKDELKAYLLGKVYDFANRTAKICAFIKHFWTRDNERYIPDVNEIVKLTNLLIDEALNNFCGELLIVRSGGIAVEISNMSGFVECQVSYEAVSFLDGVMFNDECNN